MTGPGEHITVRDWSDIDSAPSVVTGRQKEVIAGLVADGLPHDNEFIVWIPEFKRDEFIEDGHEFIEASEALACGTVKDYSKKAWHFTQHHAIPVSPLFLPKSWTVVFDVAPDINSLERPQQQLVSFEGEL